LLASECSRSVTALKDAVVELRKDEETRISAYVHARLSWIDEYLYRAATGSPLRFVMARRHGSLG